MTGTLSIPRNLIDLREYIAIMQIQIKQYIDRRTILSFDLAKLI